MNEAFTAAAISGVIFVLTVALVVALIFFVIYRAFFRGQPKDEIQAMIDKAIKANEVEFEKLPDSAETIRLFALQKQLEEMGIVEWVEKCWVDYDIGIEGTKVSYPCRYLCPSHYIPGKAYKLLGLEVKHHDSKPARTEVVKK